MISHAAAQRLIGTLEGDPDTIAQLSAYIAYQLALETIDNPSVARVAHAAERRSTEAIARAVTLREDVGSLTERHDALRASLRAVDDSLTGVLMMLEEKGLL